MRRRQKKNRAVFAAELSELTGRPPRRFPGQLAGARIVRLASGLSGRLSGHMQGTLAGSATGRLARRLRCLLTAKRLVLGVALSALVACSSISFPSLNIAQTAQSGQVPAVSAGMPFAANKQLGDLGSVMADTAAKRHLRAGVYAVEPATGKYVDVRAQESFPSASIIKVPVLVKLLTLVDSGDVSLDQVIEVKADAIGGGSGFLQWRQPGTKLPVSQVAELMITVSDNTATNMLIDLCGGKEACNKSFLQWGLTQTRVNEALPDLGGKNKLSPYDMALLLGKVDHGDLLSEKSKQFAYGIMEKAHTRTILPSAVPPGCRVAHKTGDIGNLVGDIGLITTRNGKRYIAALVCERGWNDQRANQMLREFGAMIYGGITGDAAPNMVASGHGGNGCGEGHKPKRRRH